MSEEILKLKKEIERLKKAIKKQRYGLVWMDVPEAFEDDVENKLPILKEVSKLAIKKDDGKPTHILIEGDNYHALTCLNYTHKGKIDIIYIDPPYNTGSDGFRYKDKRILDKYPDGTEVPKDHPFRHGYWLSFIRKRLELSKDLLKKEGIILISIDDNEIGQLRLLCNEIFNESNDLGITIRVSNSAKNNSNNISITHDYCLIYTRNINCLEKEWLVPKNNYKEFEAIGNRLIKQGLSLEEIEEELKFLTKYPRFYDFDHYYYCDKVGVYRTDNPGGVKSGNFKNDIYHPTTKKKCKKPSGGWRYSDEHINEMLSKNLWHFGKDEKTIPSPKRYLKDYLFQKPTGILFYDSQNDAKLLKKMGIDFGFPKPIEYIKQLIRMKGLEKGIILDFFAGSGSTAHAIIELNKNESRELQCISVTNNENKIMDKVCLPRIKNVINGWIDKETGNKIDGQGNSLKFYRTDFIGKNNILNATDQDKIELAHNAGELLAIAENTLELIKQNKYYQLFEDGNKKQNTAVYFREELDKFDEFIEIMKKLKKQTAVYIFSWGNEEDIEEFDDIEQIKIKTIPLPILEIYKQIYNLSTE